MKSQSKGQAGVALAGFVIVMVVYVVGFWPAMQNAMASAAFDPFTTYIMFMTPPAIFIAILVGLLYFVFGSRRQYQ